MIRGFFWDVLVHVSTSLSNVPPLFNLPGMEQIVSYFSCTNRQGIKWIKQKYGDKLIVIRLTMKTYLDDIERAVTNGHVVLLENIDETVDPVLDPLLGRALIKKGKCVKMGDKEVDYNPSFRLILHTKLANPHYKPEMQAQTTLINFTVTRDGYENAAIALFSKVEILLKSILLIYTICTI